MTVPCRLVYVVASCARRQGNSDKHRAQSKGSFRSVKVIGIPPVRDSSPLRRPPSCSKSLRRYHARRQFPTFRFTAHFLLPANAKVTLGIAMLDQCGHHRECAGDEDLSRNIAGDSADSKRARILGTTINRADSGAIVRAHNPSTENGAKIHRPDQQMCLALMSQMSLSMRGDVLPIPAAPSRAPAKGAL